MKYTSGAQELIERLITFSGAKKNEEDVFDFKETVFALKEEIQSFLPEGASLSLDVEAGSLWINGARQDICKSMIDICKNAAESLPSIGGHVSISLASDGKDYLDISSYLFSETVPDRFQAMAVRTKYVKGKTYLLSGYLLRERHYAQITVTDNGCGLDPETMEHIFDPFFTTKKTRGASGLGLPAAQAAVISAAGAIVVETPAGAGTKVHMFLPMAVSKMDAQPLQRVV